MTRAKPLAILFVALLVASSAASADVSGEPVLSASIADDRVAPGERTQLSVAISNRGEIEESTDPALTDRVTTARSVSVELGSGDAPLSVRSGTREVGSVPDGGVAEAPFEVAADEGAEPGTYELPVTVTYGHTSRVHDNGTYEETTETRTLFVEVRVEERARFAVTDVESDLAVGASGPVTVTMENVGSAAARDAGVTVQSGNEGFTFGGSPSASSYAGAWAPDERRTFVFDADVTPGVTPRTFLLTAQVAYEDGDGAPAESDPRRFGVTPRTEQTFAVESVNGSLRVGDEGELSGELVNTGDETARNVVVRFEPESDTVNPVETEYAVGTLEPDERTRFSFDTEISESAGAGPRLFTLDVRYRNAAGDRREAEPIDVEASVAPQRDEFSLRDPNATFAAGENDRLTVQVTNDRGETVRDVSAKLYADAPVSAADDEAFVDELRPGETAELVFSIGVDGDAVAKQYPVKLDFRYELPDGDTRISDTYQLPVNVEDDGNGGPPLAAIGGVLLLVAAIVGATALYRGQT